MPRTYLIRSGDNLALIAQQNGTSVSEILKLNPHIKDRNLIFADSSLTLPDAPATVNTGSGTPAVAPAAPAAPDYSATAKAAGQAGLGTADLKTILTANEDEKAAKDEIAKQFGYADSNSFFQEVFQKPSKTTEQYYTEAYSAAGLDKLAETIAKRRADLSEAEYSINSNPWKTEASRRGDILRLQALAEADIKNLISEYDLKHGKVKELIARFAEDLGADEKIREARFKYLESSAKTAAEKKAIERLQKYLPDYADARASEKTTKPQVVKIGSSAYQFDPLTNDWKLIASAPKGSTSGNSGGGSDSKAFAFTSKQLAALQARGLSADDANGVLADVLSGIPLEDIRQQMRANDLDPRLLDDIMYFVDPARNTPARKTSGGSSSTSGPSPEDLLNSIPG